MNLDELNKVALAMVAPGKGILAADESTGTRSLRVQRRTCSGLFITRSPFVICR